MNTSFVEMTSSYAHTKQNKKIFVKLTANITLFFA